MTEFVGSLLVRVNKRKLQEIQQSVSLTGFFETKVNLDFQ